MSSEHVATAEPLTLEAFQNLPDEVGWNQDLVRGYLVREPWPGALHGDLVARLGLLIGTLVVRDELGRVATNAGFLLADDPPTVRAPDVAFVSRESVPAEGLPVGYWRVAPVLAIEVVSPSNTIGGMREKVMDYLDAGSREVWVVDPAGETVTIHRSRRDVRVLTVGDRLEGGRILPGFTLSLADLFSQ